MGAQVSMAMTCPNRKYRCSPGLLPMPSSNWSCRGQPKAVTLCCLAPLTNVALAMAREPRLANHLAGIVLMGGSLSEGGNITAAAEFNFYVDPEAAARVFSSGAAITMIPLDCTHQALLTDERLETLRAAGTRWERPSTICWSGTSALTAPSTDGPAVRSTTPP